MAVFGSSERATRSGDEGLGPSPRSDGLVRAVRGIPGVRRTEHLATLRQEELHLSHLIAVTDGFVFALSYAIAYFLWNLVDGSHAAGSFGEYLWVLWIVVPSWLFFSRTWRLHDPRAYLSPAEVLGAQARVHLIGGLLLLASMYVTASWEVSRLFLELFIAVSFAVSMVERGILLVVFSRGAEDADLRNVLIVGTDATALAYSKRVEQSPHWRQCIVGFLAPESHRAAQVEGIEVLGPGKSLATVLGSLVVDEVVAVSSAVEAPEIASLSATCAEFGVPFRTLVKLPESSIGGFRVECVGPGLYVMTVDPKARSLFTPIAKRAIDVVGSLIGLVICAGVYAWYRHRLCRESPGSALFAQKRVGRNGRLFTLYKFRTMYPGAENDLEELRDRNHMRGWIFKMRDDPRVVPSGRLLRRTHLDELPQFWNVLRGEMSLVGTRPPTPPEVLRYAPRHHRRLSIKPGMTGLWQISGNERVNDFEAIVALDCEYIETWSIWLDLRIMARTITKILRAEGW